MVQPRINVEKHSMRHVVLNGQTTLPCIAQGHPVPTYRWVKHNNHIAKNARKKSTRTAGALGARGRVTGHGTSGHWDTRTLLHRDIGTHSCDPQWVFSGNQNRCRSWRALYSNVKYLTLLANTKQRKKRNAAKRTEKRKNCEAHDVRKNHNKNVSQIVKMWDARRLGRIGPRGRPLWVEFGARPIPAEPLYAILVETREAIHRTGG